MLKISKGGITISGGEPMMQRPFVMQIFRRCKALGLHTCLDTSGRLGDNFTDEQLMDIDFESARHQVGRSGDLRKDHAPPLKPTLDYAQRLSDPAPKSARPDAVFAANDLLAVGLLQAFSSDSAIRVPEDIAMVGYDDIDFASATASSR